MTRSLRVLIVVLVCLACALPLAPASYADRMVHRDARHDVVKLSEAHPDGVVAPNVQDPDVVRAKVAHRAHHVVIKLWFADLRRHRARLHFAEIHTPRGARFGLVAFTAPELEKDFVLLDNGRRAVACHRLRYQLRYQREWIRVAVPRTCLKTPRWVKVGVGVIRPYRESIYVDDALQRGGIENLRKTRKLYRS